MDTPLTTVEQVDLERFMGDWFVIASIPTFAEKNAYAPVETYTLNANGTINAAFRYGKPSNPDVRSEINATGHIKDHDTNAVWGMQFIWPIKADYRIIQLDPEYQVTMIGRNKRDYLWIMARDYPLPQSELNQLIDYARTVGYDTSSLQFTSWQTDVEAASIYVPSAR